MYSPRVEHAVITMLEAHGVRRRKAGRGFQASRALSVAMIVTDYGFDEDTVVAALLHDTLEDTELEPGTIKDRFGTLVLDIVRDVSEPPRPLAWRARKLAYIAQIRDSRRPGAWAVAAADKIHNLSKMTQGLRDQGATYVDPFSAPVAEMIWYHEAVLAALRKNWNHPILTEQTRRLDAFVEAAADVSAGDRT